MFGRYHIPTQHEPKQLRSTLSYIYYTDDKKGEGATGSVFGGREKKSGERVAVKVFNNVSHRRPGSVQDREFDVLLKLKNPNIVTLLAIEDDSTSSDRVIVMELCAGGSLFNVLDKPENAFGLAETEFLILLRGVSQGMKHLQDKGIVHRDLKPGNIMCCFGPDGSSVYKLADFGAARELAEGENFVSIYGTEEYLHPDVYQRAVLRQPLVRPFTASVDLWSIGVTLFHAATGVLPFRPYGGRRNRSTMHRMTTLKASGIISGVQRGSENSPIEWSTELPKTTQISQGLRLYVEEMLAGLLESDMNKMWSFVTFFDNTQSIGNKTVVDVFYIDTSQLLKIYIDPTYTYAEFQEYVAVQTSLPSTYQMHVFDDAIFYPESNVPCSAFPETSQSNPIFLFKKNFSGNVSPVAPVAPTVPQVQTRYSLSTDAAATKKSIAALFCLKRKQESLLLMQNIPDIAVKAFTQIIKDEGKLLTDHLAKLDILKGTLQSSLESWSSRIRTARCLARCLNHGQGNGNKTDIVRVCDGLQYLQDKIEPRLQNFKQLCLRLTEESGKLNSVNRVLVDQDVLKKNWTKQSQCLPKDKCVERFDVKFYIVLEIYSDFCRDSKESSLSFNSEQIHKMEKIKFNDMVPQIVSLVHDCCETNWLNKHSDLMEWCSLAYSLRQQIAEVDKGLTPLVSDFSTEELAISEFGEKCLQELKRAESDIKPHGEPVCVRTNFHQVQYPVGCTSVSLQTSSLDPRDTRQFQEATTQTSPTTHVSDTIVQKENSEGVNTDECVQRVARVYSGIERPLIAVPRDLKKGLQEFDQGRQATQAMVKKGQELTEEMQNMSLDLNDPSLDLYGC